MGVREKMEQGDRVYCSTKSLVGKTRIELGVTIMWGDETDKNMLNLKLYLLICFLEGDGSYTWKPRLS